KISELKQLMGVVEATFNKDGTEKKISDWKPEGMEDSELDRVRREQNLRDRGFKERMSKMARLFGESFGEEDELDKDSETAQGALTKEGSKACVFREAPKKPSASTSTETTPSSATDTGPSKGDDKNPGPGVLDDATGDDGE